MLLTGLYALKCANGQEAAAKKPTTDNFMVFIQCKSFPARSGYVVCSTRSHYALARLSRNTEPKIYIIYALNTGLFLLFAIIKYANLVGES